jgi:hypothetical protein
MHKLLATLVLAFALHEGPAGWRISGWSWASG